MAKTAIRVQGLSKQYRIGRRADTSLTLRDSLTKWGGRVLGLFANDGRKTEEETLFWALKDVSFEVSEGEVIGIIGPNGAGKTTLLKILSRITEPTLGRAEIHGRVASLLAVGTGFHPELTGRENIYLNGAILGMRKADINRKFDEIVAFAEVEKFIDTPVKYYSSGMYVRLAFAVAAYLECEILLVDEVLAVGDAAFQKKCLGKMNSVAGEGRTVLFVSHNMGAIQGLCNRAIVLRNAGVVMDGPVGKAVEEYLRLEVREQGERSWSDVAQAPGNDVVRLLAVRLKNGTGAICSLFDVRDSVTVEIEYTILREGYQICSVVEFLNALGQALFYSFDHYTRGSWGEQPSYPKGLFRSTCVIPGDFLAEGGIALNLRIFSPPGMPDAKPHVRALDVVRFSVSDRMDPGGVRGSFPYDWKYAIVRPRLRWDIERLHRTEEEFKKAQAF